MSVVLYNTFRLLSHIRGGNKVTSVVLCVCLLFQVGVEITPNDVSGFV